MQPRKSRDDYLKLIDEAVFELTEMAVCVEEQPEDELADLAPHCLQVADYLKNLRTKVAERAHDFNAGELEYMPLVRRLKNVLPFYSLLREINEVHLRGVE